MPCGYMLETPWGGRYPEAWGYTCWTGYSCCLNVPWPAWVQWLDWSYVLWSLIIGIEYGGTEGLRFPPANCWGGSAPHGVVLYIIKFLICSHHTLRDNLAECLTRLLMCICGYRTTMMKRIDYYFVQNKICQYQYCSWPSKQSEVKN